jgi:uncharacterized protein DUF5317
MVLFVSAIALAIALGYVFGGRLKGLGELRVRWWGLALGGLALQFVPLPEGNGGTDLIVRTAVLAASYSLLLSFGAANLKLPGMPLVLLGLAANLVVIAANGGMPVSASALRNSGQADLIPQLREAGADKHHLMGEGDVLTPLGDVIGVPKPIGQAISIGDVFQYAGLMWLAIAAMRGRIRSSQMASEPYRGKHRRGEPPVRAPDPVPPVTLPAAMRSGTER